VLSTVKHVTDSNNECPIFAAPDDTASTPEAIAHRTSSHDDPTSKLNPAGLRDKSQNAIVCDGCGVTVITACRYPRLVKVEEE